MAVRVVDVILPGLFESAQGGKLRDEQIDQPDIVHEPQSADVPVCHAELRISRVGGEGLVQLREYPLLCYIQHLRRIALRGKESCPLRRKAEFGGEAHQAQHPESVLAEHSVRLAHGAEHFRLDVLPAAEKVGVLFRQRIEINRIAGEVPP